MATSFKIIIDPSKVAADLVDFPVYVDLANFPQDFWDTVTDGGGDIRCYDVNDNELAREVVSCDTALKSGELHVKANLSSTVPTILKIVVDGTSTDYDPTDSYGSQAVWTNNFGGVWHLDNLTDSTETGNNFTNMGSATFGAGVLGSSAIFNGTTSSRMIASWDVSTIAATDSLTYSLWINRFVDGTMIPICVGKHNGSNSRWYLRTTSDIWGFVKGAGNSNLGTNAGNITNDEWVKLDYTWDGTTEKAYRNGQLISSDTNNTTGVLDASYPLTIGRSASQDVYHFTGAIDELRTTPSVVRSPEWISTEYSNQSDPTSFYTIEDFVQAPIPYSEGFAYAYANVGYSAPNSGQGYGYSYENVGYSAPNSGDGYGYSYENVGFNAPNSGVAYGYSYENVTIYVIDNDSMLPPIIS